MVKQIIIFLVCLITVQIASAMVMWDEPVAVCSYDNIYFRGTGTATSDGCHILLWTDTVGSQTNVWLQKFNAQQQPQWTSPTSIPFCNIFDARIVETSDHNYLILSDGGNYTYAWKLSGSGAHLWNTNGVIAFNSYDQTLNLDIKADNSGGAYLTWTEEYWSSYYQLHIQHIDSSGSTYSFNGFIMNPNISSLYSPELIVLPDNDIVITCRQDSLIILKRLNPDFTTQWSLQLNCYNYYNTIPGLADKNNGSFYLTVTSQTYVKAYNYSYDGTALWNNPVEIAVAPGYPYYFSGRNTQQFSPPGQTTLIVMWTDGCRVWLQKLNDQGQALWQPGGLLALQTSSELYTAGLVGDGNGGCFVAVNQNTYLNNQTYYPIYAQHVFNHGTVLTQQVLIKNALSPVNLGSEYSGFNNNGQFLLYWLDYAVNTGGIYHQVMDAQGNLLIPEPETPFHCSSVGQIANFYSVPSSWAVPSLQNTMVIWLEQNFLSTSSNRLQICYQIINPSGFPLFPEGKRTIFTGGAYASSYVQVETTPEGNTLIVWVNNGIWAQLVDVNGNQLWEPNGRLIKTGISSGKIQVTSLNGALYFIWNVNNSQGQLRIYGQKLVSGVPLWPADGLQLVADYPAHPEYEQQLYDFKQGILFFSQGSLGVHMLPLDINNDPPTSSILWGMPLAMKPSSTYGQDYINSHPLDENLLVHFSNFYSWWDGHEWYTQFYPHVQLVNAVCDTLAGNAGVGWGFGDNIVTSGNDVYAYSWYYSSFTWYKASTSFSLEYSHVFSFPGSDISSATVKALDNGYFLVLAQLHRNDGYHFIYFYIDPQGNQIVPADGDLFVNTNYLNINYCINNNRIYPLWNSTLSGVNYSSALFLQKLSDGGVGIIDETDSSAPLVILSTPYPNPFTDKINIQINQKITAPLKVSIYNIKGQQVTEWISSGTNQLVWDGKDTANHTVGNGVYLLRIETGTELISRKIIKVR